jgi:hypothetical protein
MSLRCRVLGWHSFKLVARDMKSGTALECSRCRRRMRVKPLRQLDHAEEVVSENA